MNVDIVSSHFYSLLQNVTRTIRQRRLVIYAKHNAEAWQAFNFPTWNISSIKSSQLVLKMCYNAFIYLSAVEWNHLPLSVLRKQTLLSN